MRISNVCQKFLKNLISVRPCSLCRYRLRNWTGCSCPIIYDKRDNFSFPRVFIICRWYSYAVYIPEQVRFGRVFTKVPDFHDCNQYHACNFAAVIQISKASQDFQEILKLLQRFYTNKLNVKLFNMTRYVAFYILRKHSI